MYEETCNRDKYRNDKKKNAIIILVYSEHEKTKEDERIALNNEGETEHSETVLK